MSKINYFSGIVKILEIPRQRFLKNKITRIRFRAELPQKRGNRIISVVLWGKLGDNFQTFYNKNDYILIEGFISFRSRKEQIKDRQNQKAKGSLQNSRPITLTGKRVYPLLLDSYISKVFS